MATHDLTANGDSTGQAQERSLQERGRRLGVYLISPLVLTLTFIFAFPTVMIFYLAFSFWGPLDGVSWLMAHQSLNWFVNFGDIFRDAALWGSIWRTLLIMLVVVPTEFMIGLGLGMLFVRSFPRQAAVLFDPVAADDGRARGHRLHVLYAVPSGRPDQPDGQILHRT